MSGRIHLLGIRHHGPGSARSVLRALESLQPDCVAIEAPTEVEPLLARVGDPELRPPVAALVFQKDQPSNAIFAPFAEFSPEWVAARWAAERGVPVRAIDLPAAHTLAGDWEEGVRGDAVGRAAAAAGYEDAELWWEHTVEHGEDDPFPALGELMGALREGEEEPAGREAAREAWMRRTLKSLARSHEEVAVVCGAFHVPALGGTGGAVVPTGMPKVAVQALWVPWTYGRLAASSGYGAGVNSPHYYEVLWREPGRAAERWILAACRALREEGFDASPAQAVDATRLAEALAALRGLPAPGLGEMLDALLAAVGSARPETLVRIRARVVVGDRLGEVPASEPAPPLLQDFDVQVKTLKLKKTEEEKTLEVDLRKELDLARSVFFCRLRLLGVGWASPEERSSLGTFAERWKLTWRPDYAVALVEAGLRGNTVVEAAVATAAERASAAPDLAGLAELASAALRADLAAALPEIGQQLRDRAALADDEADLLRCLPPLAEARRYRGVRELDAAGLDEVYASILERAVRALPRATAGLDDEAAEAMADAIEAAHQAIRRMEEPNPTQAWLGALTQVRGPGLLAGQATRLLAAEGAIDEAEAARRLQRATSHGEDALVGARFIEGFLGGSGMSLALDDGLWATVDGWLCGIPEGRFEEVLPLLRRTWALFSPAERRKMARRVWGSGPEAAATTGVDPARAAAVDPMLDLILGGQA